MATVLDLSHLRCTWFQARDGVELARGVLPTPQLAAGEHGRLPLPRLDPPDGEDGGGERRLTVRAELAESARWAPRRSRGRLGTAPALRRGPPRADRTARPGPQRGHILLGRGRFDRNTGALLAIGELPLRGPRLNTWRAPPTTTAAGTSATPPTGRAAVLTGCGSAPSPSLRTHTA
ncbi:beta-galactosidase domain 4-containing protein [Streptomyces sp. NPDC051109]|uniref:DUF4981 domain-containing protein n=1 Tax=Streptomyces sp. NPDC051109 TaxID=3365642 RepID=UPI0037AB8327